MANTGLIVAMNMSGIVVSRFHTAEDAAEFAGTNANRIEFAIENRAMAADYYWCFEKDVVGESLDDIAIYEPESQPKVIIDDGYEEYEEVTEEEEEMTVEKDTTQQTTDIFIMAQKSQFEYIIKMGETVKLSIDGTTAEFKGTVALEDGYIVAQSDN